MKAVFSLTTTESKRLIAKYVVTLPKIKKALKENKVIIAGGTTNAYIVEELLNKKIDKAKYTAGIITNGLQCMTPVEERIAPISLDKGEVIDKPWPEVLNDFSNDDVFIKGANAIDYEGVAGVLAADFFGGTIGKALGILQARGSKLIIPVGLEKMIPSVKEASKMSGINELDYSLGSKVGLIPVLNGEIVNEIVALENYFDVKAVCLAAGGVGGSEGGVTLGIEGSKEAVNEAMKEIKKIKGEPRIESFKQKCRCKNPCNI